MKEYNNPPSNSLIATSVNNGMSSEKEVGETSLSDESVGSAVEGGLEIDEEASTVSLVRNPCVVPDVKLGAKKG